MVDRNYQKLRNLDDERKMDRLESWGAIENASGFDVAEHIPGTLPEKMIYQHLVRLGVRFQFQYHAHENFNTYYPESNWTPDFILPDYNDTLIEVYGTYWHSIRRDRDQIKKAYWLMQGYAIVENGVELYPNGPWRGGKVIIWWDYEIYRNIAGLFARDLPNVIANRIKGAADELLIDAEKQFKKMESQTARLRRAKKKPRIVQQTSKIKKLKKKIYGQTPVSIQRRG